ncbi:hypothetical protein BDR07DRAFT_273866 [Suillus spraguei]|nr:hypothetical protein BDR07DRAFT_273866 [Suillus spraguei]
MHSRLLIEFHFISSCFLTLLLYAYQSVLYLLLDRTEGQNFNTTIIMDYKVWEDVCSTDAPKFPLNYNKFVLNLWSGGVIPLNFMGLCKEVEKVNRNGNAEGVVMSPCIETRDWPGSAPGEELGALVIYQMLGNIVLDNHLVIIVRAAHSLGDHEVLRWEMYRIITSGTVGIDLEGLVVINRRNKQIYLGDDEHRRVHCNLTLPSYFEQKSHPSMYFSVRSLVGSSRGMVCDKLFCSVILPIRRMKVVSTIVEDHTTKVVL